MPKQLTTRNIFKSMFSYFLQFFFQVWYQSCILKQLSIFGPLFEMVGFEMVKTIDQNIWPSHNPPFFCATTRCWWRWPPWWWWAPARNFPRPPRSNRRSPPRSPVLATLRSWNVAVQRPPKKETKTTCLMIIYHLLSSFIIVNQYELLFLIV